MKSPFKSICDLALLILTGCVIGLIWLPTSDSAVDFSLAPDDNPAQLENFTVHLKLAQTLQEKEPFWTEAETEFQLARSINPKDHQPLLGLARLAVKQVDWRGAVHYYRASVEANPDLTDENTPHYLGKELIAFTKSAIRRFRRLERDAQNDPTNKQNLKNVYYLKRKLAGGCG